MLYDIDEIFQYVPDSDDVLFSIPPEICGELNWVPGDTIRIVAVEGALHLEKIDVEKL